MRIDSQAVGNSGRDIIGSARLIGGSHPIAIGAAVNIASFQASASKNSRHGPGPIGPPAVLYEAGSAGNDVDDMRLQLIAWTLAL